MAAPIGREEPVTLPRPRPVASGRFLVELECLRGVAISLVFLYHVAGFIDGTRGHRLGLWVSPLRAFVHGGHSGVSLFFVLSSFLLALPFLEEVRDGRHVDRRRYFERRALRILPLYWLVVIATDLLLARRPFDLLKAAPFMLFLNSFPRLNAPLAPLNGVWWSLATEVQFYLLLPLVPFFVLRPRWGLAVAGVFTVAYVWLAIPLPLPLTMASELSLRHSIIGRMPLFACGIATAALYLRYGNRLRRLVETGWLGKALGDVVLIVLLLGLGLLLRQVVFTGYWEMELTRHAWHVAEGALWAGVIWVLLVMRPHLSPLVVNPALQALGRWSYSIYLMHVPLLYLFLELLPFQAPEKFGGWRLIDFGIVAALACTSIAVSALSYRYIEAPFLALKARVPR